MELTKYRTLQGLLISALILASIEIIVVRGDDSYFGLGPDVMMDRVLGNMTH